MADTGEVSTSRSHTAASGSPPPPQQQQQQQEEEEEDQQQRQQHAFGHAALRPHVQELHSAVFRGDAHAAQAYAKWAPTYDADFASIAYAAPRASAERVLRALEDVARARAGEENTAADAAPPLLEVIDLGAGTGLVGAELAALLAARAADAQPRLRVEMDALDLSQAMLDEAARKGLYRRCVAGDMNKTLPFSDGAYDCAVCTGTFVEGHVGVERVAECLRILKRGAPFVFSVRKSMYDDEDKFRYNRTLGRLMADGMGRLDEKVEFAYLKDTPGYIITLARM